MTKPKMATKDETEMALDFAQELVHDYKKSHSDRDIRIYGVPGKFIRNKPTVCYIVERNNRRNEVLRVDLLTGVARLVGYTHLSPEDWNTYQKNLVIEKKRSIGLQTIQDMEM
jgi:hypothetical protein